MAPKSHQTKESSAIPSVSVLLDFVCLWGLWGWKPSWVLVAPPTDGTRCDTIGPVDETVKPSNLTVLNHVRKHHRSQLMHP